ncbi:hypothetical protein ACOI1H_12180 [Loktanella sp. DJP18]|uniref:hypothetical protein n=1 Tax=Loktanella sp. DJP18 TaxID=3409788 RepID=UPI003BB65776
MTRILLHPGFHKTGTSSIQHFLWLNRDALAPYVAPVMLRHLKPVVRMACRFSRFRNPIDLIDIVPALDQAVQEAALRPGQDIVVSCEGLLGHLPGWPGVATYGSAPTLIACYAGYFQDRYPGADLRVVLTTRDAAGWLFSAYRHHLRGQRLTMTADDFATTYAAAADLEGMAVAVAAVIDTPLSTVDLSDMQGLPGGPGGAICDLMDLPATTVAALKPVGPGNAGPSEGLWRQFLDLNRSTLSDRAVQAEKTRLAQNADLGGWRTT